MSIDLRRWGGLLACAMVLLAVFGQAHGATALSSLSDRGPNRISDIRDTRHNLSVTGQFEVTSSSNTRICAFCHTPHGATPEPKAPIWNRKLSTATYTPYKSGSLDAVDLGQPGGKSRLCLSCHDGTLAIGAVNVLNRVQNTTIKMKGTNPDGTMPEDLGAETGFTRRLGTDLTNDHPISFTYDVAQANRDGELRLPSSSTAVQNRVRGKHPVLPLEDNKVECITCHDPHVRSTNPGENIKFLRVNRFQKLAPSKAGSFDVDNDIICLGCHEKAGWVGSAHANPAAGDEVYSDAAADLREFPKGLPVWEAACLNCHDPHTVQGARRILREGTDGPVGVTAEGAKYKEGGKSAIEEVCYACHSADGGVLQGQGTSGFQVPDIKTDFTTMARHMPIASSDQPAHKEMHDIGSGKVYQGGKDFVESRENMGKGNLTNRHAECTDCHNPHRLMKNRLFNEDNTTPDTAGTHPHTPEQILAAGQTMHTNLASGVLRGIWGVEPKGWPSTEFGSEPTVFDMKKGDPPTGGSTDVSAPYVTREYQVCLKCHSNYAYNQPPMLGSFTGGTPPGTNSLNQYTNQAMEYQSPPGDMGEGTSATPTGAFAGVDAGGNVVDYATDNHRSWHPVMRPTGRTAMPGGTLIGSPQNVRKADSDLWKPPFNMAVGQQTMYCTDCHGSTTPLGTAVPNGGENGFPWGPHGSNDNFLLKGSWSDQSGENSQNALCFRCHDYQNYGRDVGNLIGFPGGTPAPTGLKKSGFHKLSGSAVGCLQFQLTNLHIAHASGAPPNGVNNFRCTYCHISIPHGWKNKVFLNNLNDVGLEAPLLAGETPNPKSRQVRLNTPSRYYNGPYYNGATLKVRSFARSGEWMPANCGSAGPPGNGIFGANWMNNSTESCANLP